MAEPAGSLMAFIISTSVVVLFFAVIPGLLVVMAGILVGVVASLPILAVTSLTRLVSTYPPEEEAD
jgi:hypothetical protein